MQTLESLFNRSRKLINNRRFVAGALTLAFAATISSSAQAQDNDKDEAFLPSPVQTASTVPANGDVNPYGVAFVPQNYDADGKISAGDLLISNFNSSANLQGTGTTIVKIKADGSRSVFFQSQAPLTGLSTALGVLRKGLVVVGSAPTLDGTAATAGPGSLLVISKQGTLLQSITNPLIDFPWDAAFNDQGGTVQIFVSNAINGTIIRIDASAGNNGLNVSKITQIGSGYMHRPDPVALFVAPTGLVYNASSDTLYVASTEDNEIFAIGDAGERHSDGGKGHLIYQDNVHLHGPLGMVMAPNGHLLVANADVINSDPNQPSEIVEFTIYGTFVKQISVDPAQGGSFGLGIYRFGENVKFAAVDDNQSNVIIWRFPL
ncbi:MAG: hypothetical protein ABI383_07535 [Acidobacteriaceae bacterium]